MISVIIYLLLNVYQHHHLVSKEQSIPFINGVDMRPIDEKEQEPSIKTIIENQKKYDWLLFLQSQYKTESEKKEFVQKEMEDAYSAISLNAGGLINDWAMVDWTME